MKNILYILLRAPSGIVCLCQWYSLEEEWDWEAALVAYCGNMYLTWKDVKNKGSNLHRSLVADQAGTSVRLGVFPLLPGWHASPSQGYPPALNSPYPWVERGTLKVKCLAQEYNTMSPARTRTHTACYPKSSALTVSQRPTERTNREPTPHQKKNQWKKGNADKLT